MKITVEHYNEKASIETDHDDVAFDEFMELIKKVAHGVGYHSKLIEKWFNNEA